MAMALKCPPGVSSPSATTMQFSVKSPSAVSAELRSSGSRAERSSMKYLPSSCLVRKPTTILRSPTRPRSALSSVRTAMSDRGP